MRRREWFALVMGGTVFSSAHAAFRVMQPLLHLKVRPHQQPWMYSIEESNKLGKVIICIQCKNETSLKVQLTRAASEGPLHLHLETEKGSRLEPLLAAVQGSRQLGMEAIHFTGWIPPGCGICAGNTASQPHYQKQAMTLSRLEKVLLENSIKC